MIAVSAAVSEVAGYLRAALSGEFPNVDRALIGAVVDAVTAPVDDSKTVGPVPAQLAMAHSQARQRLWTMCSSRLPTASPPALPPSTTGA